MLKMLVLFIFDEWDQIVASFRSACHHIILFSISLGLEWGDELIQLMQQNIENDKKVLVIIVVWKVPGSSREDVLIKLIGLGAIYLEISSGVQHHKCVIVDGKIVTNGGCANLSIGAFSEVKNQGEYCVKLNHKHSLLEVMSMIVVTIFAFEEVGNKLKNANIK